MGEVFYGSTQDLRYGRRASLKKGQLLPKIRDFDIQFSSDSSSQPGLFTSGSVLAGHVCFDVIKPISVVRVRIICEGLVRIGDTKKTVLSSNQLLFGSDKGRKNYDKFAVGRHQYPFEVTLSPDLPTTIFRSQDLKVTYRFSAFVIRKVVSDDIIIERPFIVHNVTQALYDQLVTRQSPVQHFVSLDNGMEASVTLPCSGFFLGDKLSITGMISNNNTSSHKVKVGLKLVRTLLAHGSMDLVFVKVNKTKKRVTVVTDRSSSFLKVRKQTSEQFDLDVPLHVSEPTTKHELIDIEYMLQVSFIVQGTFSDSKPKFISCPITIAPPRSLAEYPANYSMEAPTYTHPQFDQPGNNLSADASFASNLYPCLNDAMIGSPSSASFSSAPLQPSAPDISEFSDDDNMNVTLPSYDDVISGKA